MNGSDSGGLIRVDLNKVKGAEIRTWELTPKSNFEYQAIRIAGDEKEIAIKGFIPKDAIEIMEGLP